MRACPFKHKVLMSIFACRICTENPFFGGAGGEDKEKKKKKAAQKARSGRRPSQTPATRSKKEAEKLVETWDPYIADRGIAYYNGDRNWLKQALVEVVMGGLEIGDDPVLGEEDRCVTWIGKVDDIGPVCQLVKPNEDRVSDVPVARFLVFCFAADEHFELIAKTPKSEPLGMSCDNPDCVKVGHIHIDT